MPDEYHFSEKLKVVIPRMFEFLTALTPKLLKTIFNYYKNDPSVYFITEKTIQFIWHNLIFLILNKLEIYGDKNKLLESDYNFDNCFEEYNRVIELGQEKIPNSHVGVKNTILWLDHLKSDWENTYDIGFRGSKTESGEQIYDANHVRIRQCDIRPDSLTVFNDTTPDQEFMIFVWVNNILPYIAMDSIVQASNADLDIFETIPRIGLKKNDYNYFGIE
ncbi:MAG: hypothetical protein PF487_15250 [Bacteroidales bacterium]|jgi:hypothetical protein|nr:hypothetical protein [Bacteroidales bacterium]